MNRNHFLTLATLTLLIAAVLRLWGLATYPPGPHYDEAANLLIARSVAFGGARFFPMVEAYQGREVLYYYLSVPILTFVSDSMFGLRLLSVFCNLITIAASIALGRAMFRGARGLVVGLVIGLLMTLSFPQLWLARQAYRAVTLPMMQSLALLFLFRGLRRATPQPLTPDPSPTQAGRGEKAPPPRWNKLRLGEMKRVPWLIAAGVLAGGAVYTYNSSRLFPFWLLIAGVALLWFDRAHWRQRLGQGVIFFSALAITAAPLAIYAFQRPDVFFGRLAEVTQADQSVSLLDSIVLHLKMFFISGDPYFRYNVAERPYFTLPEGAAAADRDRAGCLPPHSTDSPARTGRLPAGAALAADGHSQRDLGRRTAAQSHAFTGHGAADLRPRRSRRRVDDRISGSVGGGAAPLRPYGRADM